MKLRSRLKYIAVIITAALCLVLAGCGATVDTSFSADSDFSGKRVMTLTLSESDLKQYIKGGAAAIESTVKKYKPDALSYTSKNSGGSLVYEFTLDFNGIEDYRSKVEAVFNANPDNKVQYKIEFENVDSPFKSSLAFNENFTSIDMLGWLTYGLQKESVVDYSSTDSWYETGSSKLVIGGKEYSASSRLSMSDSESNCADEVKVETHFKTSGKAERIFTFVFSQETIGALEEKGTNLHDYLLSLTDGAALTETEDDYGRVTYKLELGELSPEEISAKTAQILLDDSISFGISAAAVPASNGEMKITVSEKINASAYLKWSSGYLECTYFMPDGTEVSSDSPVYMNRRMDADGNTYFSYYPEDEASELVFAWTPRFEKYAVDMRLSGDTLDLSLKMSVSDTMNETAQSILKEKLENSVAEGMKLSDFSEDGFKGYEVKFDSKDAAESYKNFVSYYTGKSAELNFSSLPASNGSPFTKQRMYSVYMDVRAISGNAPVELTFDAPMGKTVRFTEGSFDADEEAHVFTGSLSLALVTEEINFVGVIIAIFTATAFIGFAVLVLLNLKTWIAELKSASETAKARAAEKAAAVQAASAAAPAPVSAPTPAAPNEQAVPASPNNTAEATANTNTASAANPSDNMPKTNGSEQNQQEEEELI
ncbi:MAG: hypothetical protein HDT48_02310 [Ruminococcaceae bacterium]|nr:hypothetical protein [Oscillospiraceae bacterium]